MAQTNVQAFSGDVEISSNLAVSGNLNATGSLAQGGQKIYPERRWEVDLSSGTSTSNFYPLYLETEAYDANIGPFMFPVSFRVVGDSLSGADSFNEETLVGYARGGGASDHVGMCKVHSRRYQADEFRCLGIWEGTNNQLGIVIYLRGGYKYSLITDATDVVVNKSSYSKDNSTWAVKNASKTDVVGTSVGISELQDVSAFVQVGEVSSFTGSLILPGSTARLGIGTASPGAPLHVNGDIAVGVNGALRRTADNDLINIYSGSDSTSPYMFMTGKNRSTNPNKIGFRIESADKLEMYTNKIFIADNVGIGTESPGAKLDVNGSTRSGYNTDTTSYFGRSAIGYVGHSDWTGFAHIDSNNTLDYALLQNSSGETILNCNSSQVIHFRSGNTDKMTMLANGNFGIGITGPTYKLHVNGSLFYSSGGHNGSDDRIKYNEENITNALDIICKLKPQKYEKIMVFPSDATGSWIPTDENWETVKNAETKPWEGFTHGDEYGFIAQDVRNIPEVSFLVSGSEMKTVDESVSPEEYVNLNEDEQGTYTRKYVYEENVITIEEYTNLISENKDKCTGIYIKQVETQTPLGLNYQGIFVVAVKAIQEIDAQLQAEKVRNDALEARILALESA